MSSQLLLLSNSTAPGKKYMEHVMPTLKTFLDGQSTLLFAPYAQLDHNDYTAQIQAALNPLGITVIGLHTLPDPKAALEQHGALFVGGGNSFRLLKTLQELDLLTIVRSRVEQGKLRYMGSSAGSNMACPSLRTTNDMPIVQPASFAAFSLIPFQINPHYIDPDPRFVYMGETRARRIAEFLEENDVPVVAMREGAWLRRDDQQLRLEGENGARLFQRQHDTEEITPGSDLSWLLRAHAHFDQR